jgi:hypothetical protein
MENHTEKVETVLDLSHFEIGETITGSVYLPVDTPVDGELELLVFKRSSGKEDEYLTNHSLNIVGDNLSKEVRILSFMIIPDERWEGDQNEKIVVQTVAKKNDTYLLMDEVELIYG